MAHLTTVSPTMSSDPSDVEILHLGEIQQLFCEHLRCGETFYRENYRELVDDITYPKGANKHPRNMVARKEDVMELIAEIKTEGLRDAFKRGD